MLTHQTEPRTSLLILTEPPYNLASLQVNCDEIVFENYQFSAYIRCTTASLIPWGDLPTFRFAESPSCHEVVLVIDSGFSFTHVTPVLNGVPLLSKRINIGGKFLTNALKECLSYRQYNLMEETSLINQVKEECCFLSTDFKQDMERAKEGSLVKHFILPDFAKNTRGHLAGPEDILHEEVQFLTLRYELFCIPELLFTPSDIGMNQKGIVEAVQEAIHDLPEEVKALCLYNIVLIGGNVKFPGFEQRFQQDLRAITPAIYEIRTYLPPDPITYARQCGLKMAAVEEHVTKVAITRKQYLESNKKATLKFNNDSIASNSASPRPMAKRRESKYDETSDRSDTPRSFSPDTEPEMDQQE